VKLFKKPNSKFYWYDFTVRGRRYRGSTQETGQTYYFCSPSCKQKFEQKPDQYAKKTA
jgi:YHS domain-containing protein